MARVRKPAPTSKMKDGESSVGAVAQARFNTISRRLFRYIAVRGISLTPAANSL